MCILIFDICTITGKNGWPWDKKSCLKAINTAGKTWWKTKVTIRGASPKGKSSAFFDHGCLLKETPNKCIIREIDKTIIASQLNVDLLLEKAKEMVFKQSVIQRTTSYKNKIFLRRVHGKAKEEIARRWSIDRKQRAGSFLDHAVSNLWKKLVMFCVRSQKNV